MALAVIFLAMPAISDAENPFLIFNPREYSGKDIPSRDPWGDKPWFMDPVIEARGYFMLGFLPEAIDRYKEINKAESSIRLRPEYAFMLAMSGYYEPAMLYLDEAHIKDPSGAGAYYYAGWVFTFAGYGDLAKNFWGIAQGGGDALSNMASACISDSRNIGAFSYAGVDGDFKKELNYPESSGAVILNVYPGPGQYLTGLATGDIIMKADGKVIEDAAGLKEAINAKQPGSPMDLVIWRKGARQELKVKVNSSDDISRMPEPAGRAFSPDKKAKSRLARALSMFAERKYFTAVFIYRELIEKYPDWTIPYLGYTLALEKTGAFQCARKSVEQSIKTAEKDKDTKAELDEKLKQLKSSESEGHDYWRQAQAPKSLSGNPPVYYLGFGGGQLSFGGPKGFSCVISGRMGIITESNTDLSLNLSYDTSSGTGVSLNLAQRVYMGETASFNPGILVTYNSSGSSVLAGISGGISMYGLYNNRSSVDLVFSIPSLSAFTIDAINFSLGMTYYY